MEKLILSDKADIWMKKQSDEPFSVAGLYFDGNTAFVSGKNKGNYFVKTYEMSHKGTVGFYVPMALWDFQYREGETYRTVFYDYLVEIMKRTRKNVPDDNLVTAFSLPDRESWKREADKFCSFLEEVCGKEDNNIFPVIVPISNALDDLSDKQTLFISVEREWTELTLICGKEIKRHTSVHIGVSAEGNLTDRVLLRMNDYLRDSTMEWEEFRADNWIDAFADIMENLQLNGWNTFHEVQITCPEQVWNVLERFWDKRGLRVRRITDMAMRMIKVTEAEIRKQRKSSVSEPSKPMKPALSKLATSRDDIWSL